MLQCFCQPSCCLVPATHYVGNLVIVCISLALNALFANLSHRGHRNNSPPEVMKRVGCSPVYIYISEFLPKVTRNSFFILHKPSLGTCSYQKKNFLMICISYGKFVIKVYMFIRTKLIILLTFSLSPFTFQNARIINCHLLKKCHLTVRK